VLRWTPCRNFRTAYDRTTGAGRTGESTGRHTRAETFYWVTITFSQTLGTALGDWAADDGGLGYLGGAALFAGLLLLLVLLRRFTQSSRVWLFWAAFILTRPLGATVGDFLDKPIHEGGLNFSRPVASAVLLAAIFVLILFSQFRRSRSAAGHREPRR
jgi:uncharacterized membrane-anchored protein